MQRGNNKKIKLKKEINNKVKQNNDEWRKNVKEED